MAKKKPKSRDMSKKAKPVVDMATGEYEDSPVRVLRQTREQITISVDTFPVPDSQPLPST
jgi:hypothetical protein